MNIHKILQRNPMKNSRHARKIARTIPKAIPKAIKPELYDDDWRYQILLNIDKKNVEYSRMNRK